MSTDENISRPSSFFIRRLSQTGFFLGFLLCMFYIGDLILSPSGVLTYGYGRNETKLYYNKKISEDVNRLLYLGYSEYCNEVSVVYKGRINKNNNSLHYKVKCKTPSGAVQKMAGDILAIPGVSYYKVFFTKFYGAAVYTDKGELKNAYSSTYGLKVYMAIDSIKDKANKAKEIDESWKY